MGGGGSNNGWGGVKSPKLFSENTQSVICTANISKPLKIYLCIFVGNITTRLQGLKERLKTK